MPEPRSPRPTKLLIFVSTEVGTISARRLTSMGVQYFGCSRQYSISNKNGRRRGRRGRGPDDDGAYGRSWRAKAVCAVEGVL